MNDNTITNERLAALFATHPLINVFFITTDGMPFFDEQVASAHSQRLPDKNVLPITRDDMTVFDSGTTFASGLDEAPVPGAPLHPLVQAAYNEFLQTEGGADVTGAGGVIVPASNILAAEQAPAPTDEASILIKNTIAASVVAAAPIIEAPAAPVVAAASIIEAPAAPVVAAVEAQPLSLVEIALATPEAERTSYQKGLVTQANNAAKAAALKGGETN